MRVLKMAKNAIVIVDERTAVVTKAFAKKAVIFGTEEYKLWKEFKKDFPQAEMTIKTIKKKENKKSYKNLTYKNMELYITTFEKDETRDSVLGELRRQKLMSKIQTNPYKVVLAWFLQKYPNYDEYKSFFEDADKKNETENEEE